METNKIDLRGVNTNLSYFTLRKIIGWTGLLLPWIVWASAWSYENSLSAYYYTRANVLFVGILTLCGVFLISYRGYQKEDEKISDNIITWIAGILILIVVAVPAQYSGASCGACPTPVCHDNPLLGAIHFGCAAIFLVAMGYLSIFNFTRGDKPFSEDKLKRNRIYKICGYGMWVTLGVAGILIFILHVDEIWRHLILWVEIIDLLFFGISWLVKGKALADLGILKED
jgi:hypothetical protein